MLALGGALAAALPGQAETLRIATYDTSLSRRGPGLLLRDILSEKDKQVRAVIEVIAAARPDILLLQGIDYDHDGQALAALADMLADAGQVYPYSFASRPNSGRDSGHDLDGDGRLGEPEDMQGYGWFAGEDGMALLSRYPVNEGASRDFTGFLWQDLPDAHLPERDGAPFPSPQALADLPLATRGTWDVVVDLPDGPALHVLAFAAQTPVFDGPEDFNGLRNADQIRFWQVLLDGALPVPPPQGAFVLLGKINLDPVDGEGRHEAITALLADQRLQDPKPASPGGRAAANEGQQGDPALDTADFSDPEPGNLRVDYILPGVGLAVRDAGVVWPAPGAPLAETVETASNHRLVWVDIAWP